MRIDVLTIFPELFREFLRTGMVEKARRQNLLEVRTTDLRAFTNDRYHAVDDRPYGGGPGMLLKPEPITRALEVLLGSELHAGKDRSAAAAERPLLILLCPSGRVLKQEKLLELARRERLVLLAGRYEGFDQRVLDRHAWEEISVGEYVLSGGEVPAMVLIEGIARVIPGVLGHPESSVRDSYSGWTGSDGVDHPHYTRPAVYRGAKVPEVLVSGDHGEIERWRRRESAMKSADRRMADVENRETD